MFELREVGLEIEMKRRMCKLNICIGILLSSIVIISEKLEFAFLNLNKLHFCLGKLVTCPGMVGLLASALWRRLRLGRDILLYTIKLNNYRDNKYTLVSKNSNYTLWYLDNYFTIKNSKTITASKTTQKCALLF